MSQTKTSLSLEKKMESVTREVTRLRSLLLSLILEDREGQYRPEFVRRIKKASARKPDREFHDVDTFLAELRDL